MPEAQRRLSKVFNIPRAKCSQPKILSPAKLVISWAGRKQDFFFRHVVYQKCYRSSPFLKKPPPRPPPDTNQEHKSRRQTRRDYVDKNKHLKVGLP